MILRNQGQAGSNQSEIPFLPVTTHELNNNNTIMIMTITVHIYYACLSIPSANPSTKYPVQLSKPSVQQSITRRTSPMDENDLSTAVKNLNSTRDENYVPGVPIIRPAQSLAAAVVVVVVVAALLDFSWGFASRSRCGVGRGGCAAFMAKLVIIPKRRAASGSGSGSFPPSLPS